MKRFIGLIALLSSVLIVAALTVANAPEEGSDSKEEVQPDLPVVAAKEFTPQLTRDRFRAHGRVKARWTTTLASEVEGRINHVSLELLKGATFKKGQVLAEIEDTAYQLALADAHAGLAQAERQLLEELEQAKAAQKTWGDTKLKGDIPALVARGPQLTEAELRLKAARQTLAKAEYDLESAKIKAPYDGVVIDRFVSPGDFVQRGAQLVNIQDNSVLDIEAELSPEQIQRLGTEGVNSQVIVYKQNAFTAELSQFTGRIINISSVQNDTNHWQTVTIELNNPKAFVTGEFVELQFEGQDLLTVSVPEEFVATDGSLWQLDQNDRLIKTTPQMLFSHSQLIIIAVDDDSLLRFTPNRDGYLSGSLVQPEFFSEPANRLVSEEVNP